MDDSSYAARLRALLSRIRNTVAVRPLLYVRDTPGFPRVVGGAPEGRVTVFIDTSKLPSRS